MANQTGNLQGRQDPRPEGISDDGEEQQREDDEEQLPRRDDEVDPDQVDADLDQLGAHIGPARQARDPAQAAHPPGRIRRLPLPPRGRELGYPVVLPARRRRHAAHLRQAQHHRRVRKRTPEERPEEPAVPGRAEGRGHGHDRVLPGGHVDGDEAEGGPVREVTAE